MTTQDYLNFELNIEARDNNKIRISVIDSPIGSVSVDVDNPFSPNEVLTVIGALDGSTQLSNTERSKIARIFGEKLFTSIFSGTVYAAYVGSLERAGVNGLRIKLGLDDAGPLSTIPWELLRDPRNDYLCLSRQTPLVRYPRLLATKPLVEITLPLRVLVLISSPADQAKLDVEGEWRVLEDSTHEPRSRGLLEIERVDDAQLITLQRKLRTGIAYQVFHYIGHAAYDERSQVGLLAFETPDTEHTVAISGEALARELSEENSIRLVVLNACQGAREDGKDPYTGIASSLVARGVPAVVAMQFNISDDASRIFAQEFYSTLSEGYPIEAAVAEARRALSSTLGNMEWATPVLYLRAPTGILFPRKETSATAGGLIEALRTHLPFVLAGMVVLFIAAFFLIQAISHRGGGITTPTPIPGPQDVDLIVTSLRFLPPNPAPGEVVTVAMIVKNKGTTTSGPFSIGWFPSNPQEGQGPVIKSSVDQGLSPDAPLSITGTYIFPWWGNYLTTAWVNFDAKTLETNTTNNVLNRILATSDDPFMIDFTTLPDKSVVVEPKELKGTEFNDWGFTIAANGAGVTGCDKAIARIDVTNGQNQLKVGLPGSAANDPCTALPVTFTTAQPIGGAGMQFEVTAPGDYTLTLFDNRNNEIDKRVVTLNSVPNPPSSTIALSSTSTIQKAELRGPANVPIIIDKVYFSKPNFTLDIPSP